MGTIYKNTVHSLFEAQAERIPDGIAVIFGNQSITYGELNKKANQWALYLREAGVKPDSSVAVSMDRSIELFIAILGILKAGGAYVPLDPSHPEERLLYILKDNNFPILITTSSLKAKFAHYQGKCVCFDKSVKETRQLKVQNLSSLSSEENLAYVIYTSGSTGAPKGVLIEHKSVIQYCQWFASYCKLQPKQRIDFSSNYIFDMAISTSLAPVMLGLTIVICDDNTKKNTRLYLNYLNTHKINIAKMTPSYLKVLAAEVKNNFIALPHLHTLILGGESLRMTDCSVWLEAYPDHIIHNEYGPTETTVGVSEYAVHTKLLDQLEINVPIGTPAKNVDYYILGADKTQVPPGEIGELYIGGSCLARGYLNQPALTEEKFITMPIDKHHDVRLYKTGDLCRQRPDRTFEYIGRIDQQVKIHGFRIELEEIELSLAAHMSIKDVVVLAQENSMHEKQLVAYYTLKNTGGAPTVSQLRQFLQARLPYYMIPSAFVWVDVFPRTANDKLDHAALPTPQFSSSQHYVAPHTKMECTVADIWSEVLGIKPIGVEDDFFELGGHSLSAVQIISKIEKVLKKEISLDSFYHAPTISKLIPVLKKAKKIVRKNQLSAIEKEHSTVLPLNDFQFLFWMSNIFEPKIKKLNLVARKRIQGPLDIAALNFAFKSIFKKHEVLFYRVGKFLPVQSLQKNLKFKIIEKSLLSFSKEATESALLNSFDELINYYPWRKNAPQIVTKLFYLDDEIVELQVCMPHIISDYLSLDILFSDLSNFYLLHGHKFGSDKASTQKQFKDHLLNEHHYSQAHLDHNLFFWEEYLKNTRLFPFPPTEVVDDMDDQGLLFSTYVEMPEQGLINLQHFCAEKHVSFTDGLCAAFWLAMLRCGGSPQELAHFFMNITKSTRDNPVYDDKIGCFLRLDAIKVDMSGQHDLDSLSKQIHQSTIETMPYQRCSSMAKLAYVNNPERKHKWLLTYLISSLTYIYTKVVRSLKLSHKLLSLYGRLTSFARDNRFVVNINVLTNFIADGLDKKEPDLFGLKAKNTQMYQYDLLKINNILDVCFIRDEGDKTPYVVISGNLTPSFRESLAKEMIQILNHETLAIKDQESSAVQV